MQENSRNSLIFYDPNSIGDNERERNANPNRN